MSQGDAVLYVVATPIGNLADLSERARQVLAQVDVIAAEDTRHTAGLLASIGVSTRCVSLHDHNESARGQQIVGWLSEGQSVALVSDAGTPLISDPGYRLVNDVVDAGFRVLPVPGPSAVIAALSVAGLPTDRFTFIGFLPVKAQAREQALAALANRPETLVFYEAGRRMLDCTDALAQAFGDQRPMVVARELTKLHEQLFRGSIAQCAAWLREDDNHRRGEFVVLLGGQEDEKSSQQLDAEAVLSVLLEELSVKQSAALAAKILQQSRKPLYQMALELSKSRD